MSEYQKPFSKVGQINAELITRKAYCRDNARERCNCCVCIAIRNAMKRNVNIILGRRFYNV